jgi:tripartite-type tricarboxylate transporter receptor subunit TctC
VKLPHRRQFLHLAAGAAALPTASRIARAQAYPTRPLRLIVGFAPGGAADIVSRIIGQWLSARLGQHVIIENKPGAGSNISVQAALSSPADGYTLLLVSATQAINPSLYETLPFDFLRDFSPVSLLVEVPLVMVVNPMVPAKTVPAFIAYAKTRPSKVAMASFGAGTASHLAGELFKTMAGVDMVHVPYRGSAPAVSDLIGGQVDMMFDTILSSLPHVRSGALSALAVTGKTRSELLPDVPTIGETVSGYEAGGFNGIAIRKGTPLEIIERLNRDINAGLDDAAVQVRLAELATRPHALRPVEFTSFVAAETEKWAKVIKFAGIKAE